MSARDTLLAGLRTAVLASPLADVVRWHVGAAEEYTEVVAVVSFGMGMGSDQATARSVKNSATVRVAERVIGEKDQVGLLIGGEWVLFSVDHEQVKRVGTMLNVQCVRVEDGVGGRAGWRKRV